MAIFNSYVSSPEGILSGSLWLFVTIAMENLKCPIEIDGLLIKHGDFPWLE